MANSSEDLVGYKDPALCVTLRKCMGTDATVVNAARVSFDKEISEDEPLKSADISIIKFMAKNHHDSPFFHVQVQFRIEMPIFVAREWFRHTVGFARNEVSRRYVTTPVQCFLPDTIRERDPNKKQGSKDTPVDDHDECLKIMETSMRESIGTYRTLLGMGVAPEIARTVLPVSMCTSFIETGSLFAYARLCRLRNAPDAMKEIREYAKVIDKILSEKFPVSWTALMSKST